MAWCRKASSHYLNLCQSSLPMHVCSTRARWVKSVSKWTDTGHSDIGDKPRQVDIIVLQGHYFWLIAYMTVLKLYIEVYVNTYIYIYIYIYMCINRIRNNVNFISDFSNLHIIYCFVLDYQMLTNFHEARHQTLRISCKAWSTPV